MRRFYEDVWAQLPEELDPPDLERRRAFLLEHVSAGDRVLDIGCGDGVFTAILAAAGTRPVGADVAENALTRARRRHPPLQFVRVEPHGPFPFADGDFDVAWASEVIEHVADTARWLSEVRRVLRPSGRLLVTTPFHGRARNVVTAVRGFEDHHEPMGDHLRFYTARSLRRTLEQLSFGEVEVAATGGVPLLRETLRAVAVR